MSNSSKNNNRNINEDHEDHQQQQQQQSQKQVTHVIFDMDGLLIDSEPLYEIAHQRLASKYGKIFTFEIKKQITGIPAMENAAYIIDQLDLPLTPDEYVRLIAKECAHLFATTTISLMPGADRLVRHLAKHRIPIAVVTSTKRINFDLKTRSHLKFFSLFQHIVVTPDEPEIKRGKPSPDPFLFCAQKFAPSLVQSPTQLAQVLVFEDSIAGITAANAAGMCSVWIQSDQRFVINDNDDVNDDEQSTTTRTEEEKSNKNKTKKLVNDVECKPFLTLQSLEQFPLKQFGLPPFDDE